MTTSTEENPIFSFPDIGSYDVDLTVSLPNGQEATITRRIVIFELIDTSFSYVVDDCGTEITFTDESTTTETITEWHWEFGDGEESSDQNPVHTYLLDDTYDVTLQIRTVAGGIGIFTDPIVIEASTSETLTADFSFDADLLEVDFTDESITNTSIVSWAWDFGDGDTSTDQNPTHTYSTDGEYEVTLTVVAECGTEDEFIDTVEVTSEAEILPPLSKGSNDAVVITIDRRVITTSDFQAATPTWTATDLTSSFSNTLRDAVIDPFSPYYLQTGSEVNAYAIDTSSPGKIYKIEDVFGAKTVTLLYTVGSSLSGFPSTSGEILISRTTPGLVVARYAFNLTSTLTNEDYIAYTTDGGSSWTDQQLTFAYGTPTANQTSRVAGTFDLSADDELRFVKRNGSNSPTFPYVMMVGSVGGSYSIDFTPNTSDSTVGHIYTPYGDTSQVYYGQTNTEWVNSTEITPTDSVNGRDMEATGMTSYITDDSIMYAIFNNVSVSAPTLTIEAMYSLDAGSTWTTAHRLTSSDNPVTMAEAFFALDDPDTVFILGNRFIGYTEDITATPDQKANGATSSRVMLAIATK